MHTPASAARGVCAARPEQGRRAAEARLMTRAWARVPARPSGRQAEPVGNSVLSLLAIRARMAVSAALTAAKRAQMALVRGWARPLHSRYRHGDRCHQPELDRHVVLPVRRVDYPVHRPGDHRADHPPEQRLLEPTGERDRPPGAHPKSHEDIEEDEQPEQPELYPEGHVDVMRVDLRKAVQVVDIA